MSIQPFPNEQAFVIYKLIDPCDRRVRYIGQTNNPRRRRLNHLRQPIYRSNPELARWKQELKAQRLTPQMEPIESVETPYELTERERYWVNHYVREGADLLNLKLPGGTEYGMYRVDPRSWNDLEYHLNCARDHLHAAADMAQHMYGPRSRHRNQVVGAIKKVNATKEQFRTLMSSVLGDWTKPTRTSPHISHHKVVETEFDPPAS